MSEGKEFPRLILSNWKTLVRWALRVPAQPEITVDELTEQLESGNPPLLVDVRTLDEYQGTDETYKYGHIPNALLFPILESFETACLTLPSGETVTRDYQVGPQSRHTIIVDWIPELEQAEFSVKVDCDAGSEVVVERAEYFNYRGRGGGHASPGVIAPAMGWHFAEGYTGN